MSCSCRLDGMAPFFKYAVNYNTKSTCWHRLGLVCPKVVSGHNLDHMAPFSNPRLGFCMVFRRAHFILFVPGTRFWTQDPNFGPGISKFGPGWARDIFGAKMGPGKTWFCLGNGSRTFFLVQGPNGVQARMVLGPKWSPGPNGPGA